MKTHTRLGHAIVSAAERPLEASWILHHHERMDGSGYPDGLRGDQIPLESRIILVADAFEAITADRPYRRLPPGGRGHGRARALRRQPVRPRLRGRAGAGDDAGRARPGGVAAADATGRALPGTVPVPGTRTPGAWHPQVPGTHAARPGVPAPAAVRRRQYRPPMGRTQGELYARIDGELSWSEPQLPERERTKHVHRLHPYLGKFPPQLAEVLLRRRFAPGALIYDPFAGSGTTLVEATVLGMPALGCDVSAFNCLLAEVKSARPDLAAAAAELERALALPPLERAGRRAWLRELVRAAGAVRAVRLPVGDRRLVAAGARSRWCCRGRPARPGACPTTRLTRRGGR